MLALQRFRLFSSPTHDKTAMWFPKKFQSIFHREKKKKKKNRKEFDQKTSHKKKIRDGMDGSKTFFFFEMPFCATPTKTKRRKRKENRKKKRLSNDYRDGGNR